MLSNSNFCSPRLSLAFIFVILALNGIDNENVMLYFQQYNIVQLISGTKRGHNLAISENGLLPYQLCGSNESYLGAGVKFSSFIHKGIEQLITVTASSSWGEDAKLPRIEFLAFFRPNNSQEWNCNGAHCGVPPRGGPIISPNITCRVVIPGSQFRPGYFSIPAAESLKRLFAGGLFSVVNIMCPLLELDLPPFGSTQVDLYIGDEGTRTFSLNLCYIHVTSVRRASLCTEPLFGISKNDTNSLAFWKGITNVWPNGYHNHTLLDAFLKYHINMLGLHVTVNTYLSDEFTPYIQKYLGPNFAYRPGWNLPGLGKTDAFHNFEILSVATCQWEHRLDSQWVVAISAPDNFLFPRQYGETLDNVLDRLNPEVYSGVEIPMMLSHSRLKREDEGENVLQRWRVLDSLDETYVEGFRSIPLYNPRHTTHTCVHWNNALTDEFNGNLVASDVIRDLSLNIVHIMAISRPDMNRVNVEEREDDLQPWFDELGRRLEKMLMYIE
jgi:hypothetical protein